MEFDNVVRRSHVLVDALNRMKNPMFNTTKRFNVSVLVIHECHFRCLFADM